LVVDAADRFEDYLGAGGTAAGSALARSRASEAAQRLAGLGAGHDVFDLIEFIRFRNTIADPETYRETEHEGSAAVIEVAALVLASRGYRAPSSPTDEGPNPTAAIAAIQAAAQEILDAGAMLSIFDAAANPGPLQRLSLGAVNREMSLRNVAYLHMVEDTLTALFDEPTVETACRRVLRCTVRQIRDVLAAMQTLHEYAWNERLAALREFGETAVGSAASGHPPSAETLHRARDLWSRVWESPAACSVFTDDEIAEKAQTSAPVVRAVLRLFTTPMAPGSPAEAALEFVRGRSPLRTRPILGAPDGGSVVVHAGLLVPAIRERVEAELQSDQAAWDIYSKHRGEYLERAATDLVAAHLPGCVTHPGLEYLVPATATETEPLTYTKLVEGDALLVLDDIAVVLEAKAVALRAQSRAGHPARLRRDLQRIVTDAAEQSERMRRRILDDGGLQLRDGTWLDLSHVREAHTIAVSLEDLSGIATVTSELVTAGLLTDDSLPWTASLHDLRIISELIDRPAELLLYLRRRTDPDTTRRFHAVDEIDFFLHFLDAQLYAEPDPDAIHRELPELGPPPVRARRRRRQQGVELLTSLTDSVDAWYRHRLGYRHTPADKPVMHADRGLLDLIDGLTDRREPGWLAATTTLLDCDEATQRRFARLGEQVVADTRSDGRTHSMTIPVGTRRSNSFLLVWATFPGLPQAGGLAGLTNYITAKKQQLRVARAIGLLFDASTGHLIGTTYDNQPPNRDHDLDTVTDAGLFGREKMQGMPPPKLRPRRNAKKRRR
jgi:hypothetical protein